MKTKEYKICYNKALLRRLRKLRFFNQITPDQFMDLTALCLNRLARLRTK